MSVYLCHQSSNDDKNGLAGMMVETTTSILKQHGMVRKGGIQVKRSITSFLSLFVTFFHLCMSLVANGNLLVKKFFLAFVCSLVVVG